MNFFGEILLHKLSAEECIY